MSCIAPQANAHESNSLSFGRLIEPVARLHRYDGYFIYILSFVHLDTIIRPFHAFTVGSASMDTMGATESSELLVSFLPVYIFNRLLANAHIPHAARHRIHSDGVTSGRASFSIFVLNKRHNSLCAKSHFELPLE
eukprot:gene8826-1186_t